MKGEKWNQKLIQDLNDSENTSKGCKNALLTALLFTTWLWKVYICSILIGHKILQCLLLDLPIYQ